MSAIAGRCTWSVPEGRRDVAKSLDLPNLRSINAKLTNSTRRSTAGALSDNLLNPLLPRQMRAIAALQSRRIHQLREHFLQRLLAPFGLCQLISQECHLHVR